jgi:hypothetical protein
VLLKIFFADIKHKKFQVKRKAGWDTVTVELGTEKIRYYKRRYRKSISIEEYNNKKP